MDLEAALSFLKQVKTDPQTAAEVAALEAKAPEEELTAMTELARSRGFAFEPEALSAAFARLQGAVELDESELERVAGGIGLTSGVSLRTTLNATSGMAIEKIEIALETVERA